MIAAQEQSNVAVTVELIAGVIVGPTGALIAGLIEGQSVDRIAVSAVMATVTVFAMAAVQSVGRSAGIIAALNVAAITDGGTARDGVLIAAMDGVITAGLTAVSSAWAVIMHRTVRTATIG